ncbi:hypothetical protein N185_32835 [Sinorhizobium sp. GW3]|nr:hypothetical protein N185_32835 [Sinorhizobium sp. GW3]
MLRLVFKTSDTRRLAIRMWWARQDANLHPVGHVSSEPRNTAGTSELQRKQSKNSSAPPGDQFFISPDIMRRRH